MTNINEETVIPLDLEAIHAEAEKIALKKNQDLGDFSQEEAKKIFLELDIHKIELEMQNEELRRAQAELYEAKNRYFDLYNMAPVCYCTLNEKGLITESNLTTSTMLGFERSKLYMRPMSDFIFHDDQDMYYLNKKKIMESGEPKSCELRMLKSDGSICWVLISATIRVNQSAENMICLVMNDITEKKKMQERLEEKRKIMLIQSRYATMGEMISMIAHQWRQPLNVVGLAVANMQAMKELNIRDEKSVDENIALIAQNITYMSDTIDDFRNYFKPDTPKELTPMEEVITSVLKVIGTVLDNNSISLEIEDNSKTALMIHKNSLLQVLLNIIGNAKDALVINEVTSSKITIKIDETDDSIVLKICDNAGGIPDDIMDKIGEPYFSTKKLNGTGLGLYIAQTIIEKYFKGTFTWYNELEGACFEITLDKDQNGS